MLYVLFFKNYFTFNTQTGIGFLTILQLNSDLFLSYKKSLIKGMAAETVLAGEGVECDLGDMSLVLKNLVTLNRRSSYVLL